MVSIFVSNLMTIFVTMNLDFEMRLKLLRPYMLSAPRGSLIPETIRNPGNECQTLRPYMLTIRIFVKIIM